MRAHSTALVKVWAFLSVVTLTSWLIGRGHGTAYQINPAVTATVLGIASVKALLVFQYFMEVRLGPAWLKLALYGWAIGLPLLLLVAYWAGR